MNPDGKRLATCGLALLIALPLAIDIFSLDCGLVCWLGVQRTSAQFKRSYSVAGEISEQHRKPTAKPRAGEPVGNLFRNNCARCHGADGRGDTPLGITYKAPDFTDAEWWQEHSGITGSASLISIVSHGKGGMPAFGKKLSRTEIRRLAGYVRRFKNQKPSN